jgi:hypothetical protein
MADMIRVIASIMRFESERRPSGMVDEVAHLETHVFGVIVQTRDEALLK